MKLVFAILSSLIFLAMCHPKHRVEAALDAPNLSPQNAFTVSFLGTSSFLVQSDTATVLIDGYLTRTKLNLLGGVKPNARHVSTMLCDLGIVLIDQRFLNPHQASKCDGNMRRLDVVIATHGHFDHALDAPLIAALTGAEIVGDIATARILKATQRAYPSLYGHWDPVRFREVTVCKREAAVGPCDDSPSEAGDETQVLEYGDIELTLFETPHSTNLASRAIDKGRPKEIDFRSSIFSMKQFISLSVHVEVGGRSIVVVPTAGDLEGRVKHLGLQSDVLFLGVGGLTLQGARKAKAILSTAIDEVAPRRVFPIHWDDFTRPLDLTCPSLRKTIFEDLDGIRKLLRSISNEGNAFDVVMPPVGIAFDPFAVVARSDNRYPTAKSC